MSLLHEHTKAWVGIVLTADDVEDTAAVVAAAVTIQVVVRRYSGPNAYWALL